MPPRGHIEGGSTVLLLKAAGGGMMLLTNAARFAGKDQWRFNGLIDGGPGNRIKAGKTRQRMSQTSDVTWRHEGLRMTCHITH
jgi:hypothetical protein